MHITRLFIDPNTVTIAQQTGRRREAANPCTNQGDIHGLVPKKKAHAIGRWLACHKG